MMTTTSVARLSESGASTSGAGGRDVRIAWAKPSAMPTLIAMLMTA